MYSIEQSDVSRKEVLYLDGSHAWIICDDCNQWKLSTGTVTRWLFEMNFLRSFLIVLLKASARPLAAR